jgi:hypothetical protein
LQVPHRKCFVIGRDELLRIASPRELGIRRVEDLPYTLVLLAEMDASQLAALAPEHALLKYWRLLFHARVHAELEHRRLDGKLSEADVRQRFAAIGRTDLYAAASVLRQENLLLAPSDVWQIYEEFAAFYLELRYFDPHRLPFYFPLANAETIERVLAADVDADALFARTRLEGAARPAAPGEVPVERELPGEFLADTSPPNPAHFAKLMAAAARSRQRGNYVRAALRTERAARVGDDKERARARIVANADLDHLFVRLQKALELNPSEAILWRNALGAILGPAASGLWTVEGRLLYDLQKLCLDAEREVYVVDFVEWVVSAFRRPLRRHLPQQRLMLILKHLRKAVHRLPGVRLPAELRLPFHAALHEAVRRSEGRIRDRFRPGVRAALDSVGLVSHHRAKVVAREKIVEELLDRVVERDMLTMSDLRDAVARNRVKLPDLNGPGEFFRGDKLIRANRALARQLDGVYRRGEIYLRWLQRGTSVAFGTRVGRLFTRFVALPFGGAYILLEGYQAVLQEFTGHHYQHEHDTAWLANHLTNKIVPTCILGLFLLAVLHIPAFRRGLLNSLALAWRGVRSVCVDLPAIILKLPAVRRILQSRTYMLLYLLVLKPLLFAIPVTLALYLTDTGQEYAIAAGIGVFFVTGLLLNSPLGSHVEELLADRLVRAWQLLRRDVLPGLYYLVVGIFRVLVERLERLLYAVDEWLRFRTGDTQLSAIVKPMLGLMWFVVAYAVRAIINLFVEPTFNPIKHIPVVTVAAKLLVPFIPTLGSAISAAAQPVLGVWLAGFFAAALLFFIPGFAGFLVWELKENWRLYAANQPDTLLPEVVGSHGETVLRLLRPGLHSGTVPKLFARLRHAEGKVELKHAEGLHHVADALKRFVQRDLLATLENSRRWGKEFRLRVGDIHLGTNRIRIELRCRDIAAPPLHLEIDEQAGWLLAGISQPGWLARLPDVQRKALADALAGFYHRAGVNLVREEVEALFPQGASYGMTETALVVWPPDGRPGEAIYTLARGAPVSPPPGWPALSAETLLFSARPIRWIDWVEVWEEPCRVENCKALTADTALLRVV